MSCILAILMMVYFPMSAGQEELPFWRQKKSLEAQIINERKIVVGVKREKSELGEERFRMVGVGAVNVPLDFCVNKIQDYEKLRDVSSYFKVVRHIPDKRQIYITIEAMGYEARLLMEYKLNFKPGSSQQQMDWQVVWGTFKGMVGHFQFRDLNKKQTEVALWANFSANKLPLPAFFLKFTLEVIAEKVAQKMRSYLEASYRDTNKENLPHE